MEKKWIFSMKLQGQSDYGNGIDYLLSEMFPLIMVFTLVEKLCFFFF
jgi:hypothetical protein